MKIYINAASPYARRAMIAAHERNLIGLLNVIEINPWEDPADLHAATPVGRLPAVVMDDGTPIVESMVIMQLFNTLGDGTDLSGADPIDALQRAGLAQGIIDSSYFSVIEGRRPLDKQWPDLIVRQAKVIERTVTQSAASDTHFDYGDITLVSALGYLDFRLPDVNWRRLRPDLGDWFDNVSKRPSCMATMPS